MRASDLDLRDLLEMPPKGGVFHFAGQRAVVLDAVALGLLRAQLVAAFGVTAARGILTRFGYAHGVRVAEAMRTALPWDDENEWRRAGGRLHKLQGLVTFEPVPQGAHRRDVPFAEAIWRDSYEAEQHVLHLGQAEEPVCWSLTGFASGYLSHAFAQPIYCIEEKCRGRGDSVCRMVGRPLAEWKEAERPELAFFQDECLEATLKATRDALRRTERELRVKQRRLADADAKVEKHGLVAESPAMRHAITLAERVARVELDVLLIGESGTGKERVARLVHEESPRQARSFVALNCAALPESLLEAELFGHARGAFTGAAGERAGIFEAASGGTLFLDEIGEVPLHVQPKLLRALQEREVRRLGENRDRRIDVRIVAATNKDLATEVAAGRFRQDLYYRLRVVELRLPPLRERREDVLPLARAYAAAAAARIGKEAPGFAPEAVRRLLAHAWPGNVRELVNAMERAVALSDGARIEARDLPEDVGKSATSRHAPRTLDEVERAHILSVLESAGGNKQAAAVELGIGIATLFRKLKRYAEDHK